MTANRIVHAQSFALCNVACVLSLSAALATVGCSAGEDVLTTEELTGDLPVDPGETGNDIAAEPELLHEIEFGDSRFTFVSVSNTESRFIHIGEKFSTVERLAALSAKFGDVTSLEAFYAFASEGMEPHPALIAAHEAEALALGRGQTELAPRVLDAGSLPLDKAAPFACVSPNFMHDISPFTWSDVTVNGIGIDGISIYTCLGAPLKTGQGTSPTGCEQFHPTKLLKMVVCNDSSSQDTFKPKVIMDGLTDFFTPTLSPGFNYSVTMQPSPPPPGGAINMRYMGIVGTNKTAHSSNAQHHVGAVGNPP
jgi:hypothetical protein